MQNMADILSEGTKRKQRQVIHSTSARSFDEGHGHTSVSEPFDPSVQLSFDFGEAQVGDSSSRKD